MSAPARSLLGIDEQFFVAVGPPDARLSVSVVEPAQPKQLDFASNLSFAAPRGTVLVLHGIWASSEWMLPTAHTLSAAGYRAILVDLRGQGRSSGSWLSYGPQEAADLSQVIDALSARQLIVGDLGVYGISYGAATALHLAGRDPRIVAAVAVAPFDSMREEVPHYWRAVTGPIGKLVPDATFDAAIDEGGRLSGYDPARSVTSRAVQSAAAKILIMHGSDDWLVPPTDGAAIHAAASAGAQFILLPGLGHASIWYDADGEVARNAVAFFDANLAIDRKR
jgi:pimeloyl-ACP methyl ester carboxylesterase